MTDTFPLLDRAAHHRTDAAWLADAWARGRVVLVDSPDGVTGHVLVRGPVRKFGEPRGPELPRGATTLVLLDSAHEAAAKSDPGDRMFLGVDEAGTPYFVVVAALPEIDGTTRATLREIGHLLDIRAEGVLATALGLTNWHFRHRFSPLTGAPIAAADGGWTRVDEAGGQHWPRTDPAVIMLVHDGVVGPDGRCLLASGVGWRPRASDQVRRYSCLAGFVEPGESAEEAVAREVFEEVGVHITACAYVASQPWPYPGSLMLGFYARADAEEILRLDPGEITAARWFTRTEVLASIAAEADPEGPQREPGLPSGSSIAFRLVRGWADETF